MTLNEYRSQVGFTDLLHAMTRVGLSRDSLQTMERLTRDEVVHVELCRRMVVGLGGSDVISGEPSWVGLEVSLAAARAGDDVAVHRRDALVRAPRRRREGRHRPDREGRADAHDAHDG